MCKYRSSADSAAPVSPTNSDSDDSDGVEPNSFGFMGRGDCHARDPCAPDREVLRALELFKCTGSVHGLVRLIMGPGLPNACRAEVVCSVRACPSGRERRGCPSLLTPRELCHGRFLRTETVFGQARAGSHRLYVSEDDDEAPTPSKSPAALCTASCHPLEGTGTLWPSIAIAQQSAVDRRRWGSGEWWLSRGQDVLEVNSSFPSACLKCCIRGAGFKGPDAR